MDADLLRNTLIELDAGDLKNVLSDLIRRCSPLRPPVPEASWEEGTIVVRSAGDGTKPKEIPIEAFLKKVFTARNQLRIMEQKINDQAHLSMTVRASFHGPITQGYHALNELLATLSQPASWSDAPWSDQDDHLLASAVDAVSRLEMEEEEAVGGKSPDPGVRWQEGVVQVMLPDNPVPVKEEPFEALWQRIVRVRAAMNLIKRAIRARPDLSDGEVSPYLARMGGTLTTFNAFFANREDHFQGTGS